MAREERRGHAAAFRRVHRQGGDDVLQLPHVTRPVIPCECGHDIVADGGAGAHARGGLGPELLDEPRHFVRTFAQGRNRDADHVEPEAQVGTEPSGPYVLFERAVGRRDDARVDLARHVLSDPAHFPFLKCPEELGLRARRQLSDLVQEQRPLIGFFEETGPFADGARERPLRVAEQLRFQEIVGQRGAVHGAERARAPRSARVNRARDELFAAAALPFDQHRVGSERRAADRVAYAVGGRPAAKAIVRISVRLVRREGRCGPQRLEHGGRRGGRDTEQVFRAGRRWLRPGYPPDRDRAQHAAAGDDRFCRFGRQSLAEESTAAIEDRPGQHLFGRPWAARDGRLTAQPGGADHDGARLHDLEQVGRDRLQRSALVRAVVYGVEQHLEPLNEIA